MASIRFGRGAAVAAVVAILIIAGAALAWLLLRPVDDLRVVVTETPQLASIGTDPKQPLFAVRAAHTVTFVNAGQRPIAITGMRLIVVDGPKDATCEQVGEVTMGGAWLDYDLEPVVLARGQIAVRTVRVKPAAGEKTPVFEPMFGNEELKRMRILGCAEFALVTRNAALSRRLRLADMAVDTDGSGVTTHHPATLQTLLRRRRWPLR